MSLSDKDMQERGIAIRGGETPHACNFRYRLVKRQGANTLYDESHGWADPEVLMPRFMYCAATQVCPICGFCQAHCLQHMIPATIGEQIGGKVALRLPDRRTRGLRNRMDLR